MKNWSANKSNKYQYYQFNSLRCKYAVYVILSEWKEDGKWIVVIALKSATNLKFQPYGGTDKYNFLCQN